MGFRFQATLIPSAVLVSVLAWTSALADGSGQRHYLQGLVGNHYVHSLQELDLHFQAHVRRVVELGMEAWYLNPEFRSINASLVKGFLALHDQAKINQSDAFVREFHVDRRHAPLLGLAELYGKRIEEMNPDQRRLAESIRDEVNRIDHEVGKKYFREHGLLTPEGEPNAVARKLLRIEKIADTVDRSMSPVSGEEFHKIMESATRWLKDPADRQLAEGLEKDYARLTRGLSYEELRAGSYPGASCVHGFALIR